MKNIVSLLIAGLMMTMTPAFCASASHSNDHPISLLTEAYAAITSDEVLQFTTCGQAVFNELISRSGDVGLCKGWVKLPKGVYRITYTAQLQNSGEADVMQLWLMTRDAKQKRGRDVIASSVQVGVDAAISESEPSNFQVLREVLIKVRKTTFVSLNYSTSGAAKLSSLDPTTLTISDSPTIPFPFSLIALKIAEN